ncbi:Rnf-Nqr domain containing protein [Pseudomonas sp. McL0111]|uniref:Rnf-Nqr domain containing protein n=1 Tax=Pseudomonas sp. McL0111 TaxID=3457357 RepID=UPI00403E5239
MNRSANLTNSMLLVLLLGSTDTLAGALGTLLIFSVVVGIYGLCISPLRSRMSASAVLLSSVLLAATLTSCAETLAQRWFLPWQHAYGLYAALIALQCVVLEYNGFFRQPLVSRLKLYSLFAGLMCVLAVLRELFGQGRLGRDLCEGCQGIILFNDGLHLATLVPGAFILLGLLLAARQACTRSNAISKESHHP